MHNVAISTPYVGFYLELHLGIIQLSLGVCLMLSVTLFSTNSCGYCGMVKKYLAYKGIEYNEVNLDEHPERRDEAFKIAGVMTVPVTIVRNNDQQSVVVGYNLAKLAPALV